MHRLRTAISSFAAGAAFMYFADPNRGRRRRAIARDKVVAGWNDLACELDKARRDLSNRAQGVFSSAQSLWNSGETDGSVLVERVRSRIGRAVSHPHAVQARAEAGGRIVLEGPVLEHEVDYLLKSVRSVPGVNEVVNRLEVHAQAGNLSSLQGGVPRRRLSELAQENWTPALRVTAGALASVVLCYSRLGNSSLMRLAGGVAGAALLARAIANKSFRQIFGTGGPGAIHIDKAVHILAPVEEVFAFWANYENFPRFMTHIKQVRNLGEGRSHWVAEGPGGFSIAWDAEVTQHNPNKLLAWRSLPGSQIDTTGVVRFDQEPDGNTRVTIRMSYSPPAGLLGHAVASLFGADPKTEIDEDMVRLKSLIEIGKTRAHGATVTREEIRLAAASAERQHA